MSAAAGWYKNPADASSERFWDGSRWTDQTRKKPAAPPAGWYPDGEHPGGRRWWDGRQWTDHRLAAQQPPARNGQKAKPPKLGKAEARERVAELTTKVEELEATIDRHGLRPLADLDRAKEELEAQIAAERARAADEAARARASRETEIAEQSRRLAQVEAELRGARDQLALVNSQRVMAEDSLRLEDVGLYDFDHPAQSSASLSTDLEDVRARIKAMVRENRAVTATSGFTFNNSARQGQKFIKDMTKILLRAYNAEAENAVKTTKAGNLYLAQARLTRAAEQVAKFGAMIHLRITDDYHRLRLKEIELANSHLRAVQRERELERERRAELREQQKAEAELRREKERLEKERAHYASTLAALDANGDTEGAERVRARIADVERAINDVDYRSANIRAGHVYVISNIGAFGADMVKIGMTRRLDPMDRVRELGDASVPFRFDVHALFFADDAVGIESFLHKRFAEQRVNKVNLRREFFRVTPAQVLAALKEKSVEIVEFTTEPEAPEFRASNGLPADGPIEAQVSPSDAPTVGP